jgi:Fe-S oxidoreductase
MRKEEIIEKTKAYLCLDCGECTGSCPIARVEPNFSPRVIVEKLVLGLSDETTDTYLWDCLVCGLCSSRCPSNVDWLEFVRLARIAMRKEGKRLTYAHNRLLQKTMELQTLGYRQKRVDWIAKELGVQEEGEYLYFVGCLPYFDIIFEYLGIELLEIARSCVKILNKLGITPVISKDEVCCGRDLLWSGDEENFLKLREINAEIIKKSGAKKILFTCPECYHHMKEYYSNQLDVEFIYITNLLYNAIKNDKIRFKKLEKKLTYHDPCMLGRMSNIYDEPREILNSISQVELLPMVREREDSICCGSSCWLNCGTNVKRIQAVRLSQAQQTGAEILVTACPKCNIHLNCGLQVEDINYQIKLKDLTTLVAEAIE